MNLYMEIISVIIHRFIFAFYLLHSYSDILYSSILLLPFSSCLWCSRGLQNSSIVSLMRRTCMEAMWSSKLVPQARRNVFVVYQGARDSENCLKWRYREDSQKICQLHFYCYLASQSMRGFRNVVTPLLHHSFDSSYSRLARRIGQSYWSEWVVPKISTYNFLLTSRCIGMHDTTDFFDIDNSSWI